MADDSAADNYGCYGSTFFKTPILDRLANTGAKFNHCYSEPVCTPSRVKIMTGRSGVRNYVQFGTLDKDEITFGNIMKKAGYATAIAGKWQLHNGDRGTLAPVLILTVYGTIQELEVPDTGIQALCKMASCLRQQAKTMVLIFSPILLLNS